MRGTWVLAITALLALAACGPNMKDLQPGETGKIASVSDGDTLTMDSGMKVQLTGIIAPRRGYQERPDEPQAKEARQTLEKIALGREVKLAYGGERRLGAGDGEDKKPLALAQVFVKSEGGRWIWVQQAMLREGMARARTWKDNHARYAALYTAEDIARKAKKGIWADKAYRIRNAETIKPDDSGFQIVEGVVRSIGKTEKKLYLNFGDDYKTDFTVSIDVAALPNWTPKDVPIESLEHKRVRVRGFVYDSGGPLIRVDHAEAIEVLK